MTAPLRGLKDSHQMRGTTAISGPVRTWRIHLGAHKTATTHVQEILTLMRDGLVARGVDFIPNQLVRSSGVAKQLTRRRLAVRVPVLRGRAVQNIMAETLDPLRHGPDTMVLSEEKLLGGSQHVFSTPLYPNAGRMAALLDSLGSRADVHLFLSIRNFAGQLPSAYVQELKFLPPLEGGFDNIKRRILADPPQWSDLVARIRKAAPNTPLRIWRQEDYSGHVRQILSELCGVEISDLPDMESPYWTKSPSLEAIRAAEALPADMPQAERRARVLEIFKASPARESRFDPFSETEKQQLQAAYEADLARIREMGPDLLMQF